MVRQILSQYSIDIKAHINWEDDLDDVRYELQVNRQGTSKMASVSVNFDKTKITLCFGAYLLGADLLGIYSEPNLLVFLIFLEWESYPLFKLP